ncbi:ER membrane protein complex subunit 10 [Striga asiatica]|uniref:ER membrane protein complex subunit 10 n=1 Tax=Striga asiatica TaxID=4170 RepID=A0A5A7QDT2_STRAF|nr:ER membrane protein complex subunit 10 [Striga asiatica]
MGTSGPSPQINWFLLLCVYLFMWTASLAFQSDELLIDDEEFGLEGGRSPDPPVATRPVSTPPAYRKRSLDSGSDPDSRIQFTLEHAFGDSDFTPAGTFWARLKTSSHGGQTLTKLRFSRNVFSETEKENFKRLVEGDDFYKIRLPSNVLSAPGREYIVSSVKARCLSPQEALDEHFVFHMPTKWTFKSHTVLKSSDQAPRTPIFTEEAIGENIEGEEPKPPERSFWAKYWMYLIPLGLIVMNAMTQAMNMPEEQGNGQPGTQTPQAIAGRGQGAAVRRR